MPEYKQFNVIVDMHSSKHEVYSLYGRKDSAAPAWEKISNTYFKGRDTPVNKDEFCDLERLARAIVENRAPRGENPDGSAVVFSCLGEGGSAVITIGDTQFVPGIAKYRRTLEKEEIKELTELINDAETKAR